MVYSRASKFNREERKVNRWVKSHYRQRNNIYIYIWKTKWELKIDSRVYSLLCSQKPMLLGISNLAGESWDEAPSEICRGTSGSQITPVSQTVCEEWYLVRGRYCWLIAVETEVEAATVCAQRDGWLAEGDSTDEDGTRADRSGKTGAGRPIRGTSWPFTSVILA